MSVAGKVVIVTGASSGIGWATAVLLAQKGARVALVARSNDKLEQLSKELPGSYVVQTDMSKKEEIEQMVKKVHQQYGRIDILINNAGQGYDADVEKINTETFHKVFNVDVVGPLIAMQEVIPIMRKQKSGLIINISSGTALMFLPGMAAYSSLKRALVGVSLTAREELKKDHITVSVVYPYITATDFEKNTIKNVSINGEQAEAPQDSGGFELPPADSAEYVAEKILEIIKSGEAEIFAHDWMKNQTR